MSDVQEYVSGRALLERARTVMGAMRAVTMSDTADLGKLGFEDRILALMQGRDPDPDLMGNPFAVAFFSNIPPDERPSVMAELDRMATRTAIHRNWAKGKVIYALHPHLLTYLSSGAVERGLPVSMLSRINRPNPFLLLPPLEMPAKVAKAATGALAEGLLGCYLFGKTSNGERMCDFADPARDSIGLQFALGSLDNTPEAESRRAPGMSTGSNVLRATVPLAGSTFNVEDAVQATSARFRFGSGVDAEALRVWLPWAVRQVLLSMLYLCTDAPDTEVFRRGAAKAAGKRGRRAPGGAPSGVDEVVEVGFRLGPTLHRARTQFERQRSAADAEGSGEGRRQPPHLRGPSPHALYWTGPGGSIPAFRPRREYWVHKEELEGGQEFGGPVTVIPVK